MVLKRVVCFFFFISFFFFSFLILLLWGKLAARSKAYAKALHYQELNYKKYPKDQHVTIEALIEINTMVGQHEAADGLVWRGINQRKEQTKKAKRKKKKPNEKEKRTKTKKRNEYIVFELT